MKQIAMPKEVWEAIQTIRSFCKNRQCEDCPFCTDKDCIYFKEDPERWLKNFVPIESNIITVEER